MLVLAYEPGLLGPPAVVPLVRCKTGSLRQCWQGAPWQPPNRARQRPAVLVAACVAEDTIQGIPSADVLNGASDLGVQVLVARG